MVPTSKTVADAVWNRENPERARLMMRFFKCGEGEYGEGDVFLGLSNPEVRAIVKKYGQALPLNEVFLLLKNPVHEIRMTALLILVDKYASRKAGWELKKEIVDGYLQHIPFINNWDLVDLSSYKVVGDYIFHNPDNTLEKLADDNLLWANRIAIISTFYHIRKEQYEVPILIAEKLLHHKHDLMHKAVGWMLREIGKRDFETEIIFLRKHYKTMPRTMLRYAIEKFEEPLRQAFLKGVIE